MSDDVSLSQFANGPTPGDGDGNGLVRADPDLLAEGWMRRTVADEKRASELAEIYAELGFEVLARPLTPTDLASMCGSCAETACTSYVLIYVRRKKRDDAVPSRPAASKQIESQDERERPVEATRCLREEHQLILKVLDCFENALEEVQKSGNVEREVFAPFIEFFRGFADRCHHCKEEDRLFPNLERAGIPREGGPIGVMLYEHELARENIRAMSGFLEQAADDPGAADSFIDSGREYLNLLRAHISKEDNVLFNMADQVIQGPQLTVLTDAYREEESSAEYCDTLARCRTIADQLQAKHGTAAT